MSYQCPCCGNNVPDRSIREKYAVCPVCFWENDPIQLRDETYAGGANKVSLKQARKNYIAFGICEEPSGSQ